MSNVYLPLVSVPSSVVPFGWALYGGKMTQAQKHDAMKRGERMLNWYASESWIKYPSFMPYLRGKEWVVPTQEVKRLAREYPGRTWCLWNEPDLPTQDWTEPEKAVDLTLEWIEAIGDNGRVAGYGININRSMGWARWLDRMMEIGGPIPWAWHVHIYADNAVEWHKMYELWQSWNDSNGSLPTIISEAGGNLLENNSTSGWKSVYHFLRQFSDTRVLGVYYYTDIILED